LRRIEKGIKNIVVLENCHSESYATEEITKLIAWRRNKSSRQRRNATSTPTSWNSILACYFEAQHKISYLQYHNSTRGDAMCKLHAERLTVHRRLFQLCTVTGGRPRTKEIISHKLYLRGNSIADASDRFI